MMKRQKPPSKDTRNVLMMTAGRLFAEHGYDKVSTRMIADTAQVNLGGIHYHFGSKENLYIDAFKYAVEAGKAIRLGETAQEFPHLMETPEGQAEIIYIVADRTFDNLQDIQARGWIHEIILRELYFPSSAKEAMAVHVFKPKMDATLSFFDRINPDFTLEDKMFFAGFIGSNALFYASTVRPFKVMYGQSFDHGTYLATASQRTAMALIQLLGLPLPASLQPDAENAPKQMRLL